jgi:hypothetical protein
LQSGASQLRQITDLIRNCEFAIVALDGLRANVIFEYGLLRALDKPTIVLKEKNARSSRHENPLGLYSGSLTFPSCMNPHTRKPDLISDARDATFRIEQRAAGTLPAR